MKEKKRISEVGMRDALNFDTLSEKISAEKYFVFSKSDTANFMGAFNDDDWNIFRDSWNDLCLDEHMKDNGKYRFRRHATFSSLASSSIWYQEPDQPHYQSVDYNNLNGGVERYFKTFKKETVKNKIFKNVMDFLVKLFSQMKPICSWHIEAHQFRIYADINKHSSPTPEGIHRDGVNFVLMLFVDRYNIFGGETSIYDSNKKLIGKYIFSEPTELVIVDDENIFHGVSPIYKENMDDIGYRDMLVITFKDKNNEIGDES
ncbi:2OG-Fe dioxygenase family protein [Marinomonas sp. TI.3.20]|uniref:2OG-Fe dioxygenase family protein n=1 Tax=Marinomonas sp. TI.3.20 TaxID=3121296 RepID=UPI0031200A32